MGYRERIEPLPHAVERLTARGVGRAVMEVISSPVRGVNQAASEAILKLSMGLGVEMPHPPQLNQTSENEQ